MLEIVEVSLSAVSDSCCVLSKHFNPAELWLDLFCGEARIENIFQLNFDWELISKISCILSSWFSGGVSGRPGKILKSQEKTRPMIFLVAADPTADDIGEFHFKFKFSQDITELSPKKLKQKSLN